MPIILCGHCLKQVRDSWHKNSITGDWCECKERKCTDIQEAIQDIK